MATIKSAFLCNAKVFHKRLFPSINQFSYKVFYICFDILKPHSLIRKTLSINKFNIFSFYEKDYGKQDGSSLHKWIREILASKNINHLVDKIFLMTHPRILGYAFNPVSFWLCLDKNENLIAVLAEVHNTFGENHSYLIFNHNHAPIQQNQWFIANKEFHVSPFFERSGIYKFRFIFNRNKIAVYIDYFSNSKNKSLLTNVVCRNAKLDDSSLLKQFFAIPFMTFKIIFLIHFQALKLLLKNNKYIAKPIKSRNELTINHEKI